MKRRDFLVKSGTVLTAATFLGMFGKSEKLFGATNSKSSDIDFDKRPNPSDFSQPVMKAIAIGINAPSPHNTQSWKFKILGDTSMFLYVDEKILLPATDPPSRQIHIGAGSFIETLVIGATSLGYKSSVTYFPDGYESEKDFGIKPVAKIDLEKSSLNSDPLADYIYKRQTNRREYDGDIITETEFQTLKTLSGKSYSQLVFINKDFKSYLDIFYKGFEIESKTYRTNEETRLLFRFSEDERAAKGDGLSLPQMGYSGLSRIFAQWSVGDGDKESWHSESSIQHSLDKVAEGIASTKGIVAWITETNTFEDWLNTGRDYVRFSLALTQKELWAHPYNQAIQEYDEMKQVREQLDELMKIEGTQKIQMIIRIGRGSEPYLSYRRKLNTYIVK